MSHPAVDNTATACSGRAAIPTPHGVFQAIAFRAPDGVEHVALVRGEVRDGRPVLVRIHSECLTGDLFDSLRCDCGPQLRAALATIAQEGRGVVVYLRGQEGRGIGIGRKLQAYDAQQSLGLDTVDANTHLGLPVDSRDYGVAAEILAELGVRGVRLLTNNPDKQDALLRHRIPVVERVPLQAQPTQHNIGYLTAKRDRLGHLLDLPTTLAR
ncbi:GTP cyclohydrolase II/3,4-dihydroxy 2-butanone 4-phosphate synthase / GTP cyclohydrolase II [Saccharopolyspora shandongensis]|uniref:GTP cyclohydrolase-2 n=1 Tax=Saccharopolyspora shandongensis TaxID=418495 RepID=A0A1H3J0U9_9PSEU|nr:GTP cyclohydrolase II/3,4-dihydroxy 2-butanone 4-phosphate synthase / GTP cyclohydrolase II [Saccharopolyspora shandongensis]